MTRQQQQFYQDNKPVKDLIKSLKGRKFKLDCGHHVTFGHHLGNDITIFNGKNPKIICSLCGH